jgi:hypothetical protein
MSASIVIELYKQEHSDHQIFETEAEAIEYVQGQEELYRCENSDGDFNPDYEYHVFNVVNDTIDHREMYPDYAVDCLLTVKFHPTWGIALS